MVGKNERRGLGRGLSALMADVQSEPEVTATSGNDRSDRKVPIEKLHAKFGKTIEAAFAVNEDLVGGFRLKIENEILDYSVATQLETFKKQVLNA